MSEEDLPDNFICLIGFKDSVMHTKQYFKYKTTTREEDLETTTREEDLDTNKERNIDTFVDAFLSLSKTT